MSTTVRVVTDSACDVPEKLAGELGLVVVPLTIRFGSEEFVDRRDLSPSEFWRRCSSSSTLPETAAPAPGLFENAFRAAADAGCTGVVCICLSSKLSATIGSAQLAATSVADAIDVRVVDSLSITMGQGLMAIEAARAAGRGADLDEVERVARSYVGRTRVYGALDTLDNLKKGGRIGGAQALIGSLLQVKPIVDVSSGAVESPGKQRTRGKALAHLVSLVAAAKAEHGSIEHLSVMHGDAADVDSFLDQLSSLYPREEIVVGQIGAVIGSHGGRGVMGISFNVPTGAGGTESGSGSGTNTAATG